LGRTGWREDLRHALDLARGADPLTYSGVAALAYFPGISSGALAADDRAVREIEDALGIAERAGNDMAPSFARMALGVALAHRHTAAERDRGLTLMAEVSDVFARHVHNLAGEGQLLAWGIAATGVLVQTLLDRGADGDVAEAQAAIERLAVAPADEGLAIRDIWLLRLRALLARAHGDDAAYSEFRNRYRDMATSLGFEGHIAWAEAMP
jgi:hypothetical protein